MSGTANAGPVLLDIAASTALAYTWTSWYSTLLIENTTAGIVWACTDGTAAAIPSATSGAATATNCTAIPSGGTLLIENKLPKQPTFGVLPSPAPAQAGQPVPGPNASLTFGTTVQNQIAEVSGISGLTTISVIGASAGTVAVTPQ